LDSDENRVTIEPGKMSGCSQSRGWPRRPSAPSNSISRTTMAMSFRHRHADGARRLRPVPAPGPPCRLSDRGPSKVSSPWGATVRRAAQEAPQLHRPKLFRTRTWHKGRERPVEFENEPLLVVRQPYVSQSNLNHVVKHLSDHCRFAICSALRKALLPSRSM